MWVQRGSRRYFYLSRRIGNQVRRIYVGSGPAAELAASLVEHGKAERKVRVERLRRDDEAQAAATEPLDEFCRTTDLLMKAVLNGLGFHQHHREWRLRRNARTTES